MLRKKKDFICFQKVTLAVSKLRHLPHLPPLRYGHASRNKSYDENSILAIAEPFNVIYSIRLIRRLGISITDTV
jgi:hypothetical protein